MTSTQTPAGRDVWGRGPRPAGQPCVTCGGSGITDDGDRLCPECRPVKR